MEVPFYSNPKNEDPEKKKEKGKKRGRKLKTHDRDRNRSTLRLHFELLQLLRTAIYSCNYELL